MERKDITVGGISLTLFSKGQNFSCGIFMLHGRQESVELFISRDLDVIESLVTNEHCVILIEQRNHGKRLIDSLQNEGKRNPNHALDMYANQYGTAIDIQYLIQVLPLYMNITKWGVCGYSMGGHATFLALSHVEQLKCGVSVCGCGDYENLMKSRKIELSDSLKNIVKQTDPVYHLHTLKNKRILALYGGLDTLVPQSANETLHSSIKVLEDPKAKHEFTLFMKKELVDFLHCNL